MKTKSQIQLGETIAIMLVFAVLVGLGFAFYVRISKISLQKELLELEEQRAIQKVQSIINLPELICSSERVISENCVDLYKIKAASEKKIFKKLYYQGVFGSSSINVTQLTPAEEEWEIYSNPKGVSASAFYLPVVIHDPIENTNNFGLIKILIYTK